MLLKLALVSIFVIHVFRSFWRWPKVHLHCFFTSKGKEPERTCLHIHSFCLDEKRTCWDLLPRVSDGQCADGERRFQWAQTAPTAQFRTAHTALSGHWADLNKRSSLNRKMPITLPAERPCLKTQGNDQKRQEEHHVHALVPRPRVWSKTWRSSCIGG